MLVSAYRHSESPFAERYPSPKLKTHWIAIGWLLIGIPVPAAGWQETGQLQAQMKREILPMLQTYCGDCHSGPGAEGGLDLEPVQRVEHLLRDAKRW